MSQNQSSVNISKHVSFVMVAEIPIDKGLRVLYNEDYLLYNKYKKMPRNLVLFYSKKGDNNKCQWCKTHKRSTPGCKEPFLGSWRRYSVVDEKPG